MDEPDEVSEITPVLKLASKETWLSVVTVLDRAAVAIEEFARETGDGGIRSLSAAIFELRARSLKVAKSRKCEDWMRSV